MTSLLGPAPYPSLPPGSISFDEIEDLKRIHYDRARAIYLDRFIPDDPLHTLEPNDYLKEMHRQYLLYCKSRFLCLRKVQIEHEYKAIPYVVRGSESYTHRSKVRVHRIMDKWASMHMPHATMITIAPRATGSPYQRYLMMKILWMPFCNWLRMRDQKTIPVIHTSHDRDMVTFVTTYGTRGNYIWCMEPTKRHYPHYHMILGRRIADLDGLKYDILDWWKAHGVDIGFYGVKVEACRGSDQARAYALKYVSKGASDPFWSAILWLTHGRIVGVSRPLAAAPLINSQAKYLHSCCSEPKKIAGWDLIGVLPSIFMEMILSDRPPPDEIRRICAEYLST